MSGWIKLEKDLLTDPHFMRIAKALGCNAHALQGVTLALGALAQLWMIADTHIGEDDILALGVDEINELVGLSNFAEILPINWLEVIDAHHVKLPGYHEHNGTIAKKRALTAKRVERNRDKARDKAKRSTVTECNAPALPDLDQDLDHTKTIKKGGSGGDDKPPDDLNLAAWDHYVAYRKSAKLASLKAVSIPAAQRQLVSFGNAAAQLAAVKQTVANGWTGLFAVKSATGANNGAHRQDSRPRTSTVERVEQATADWATERGVDPKTI